MPRFFIDVIDYEGLHPDDEGVLLDALEDAKALAARVLVDLIERHAVEGSNRPIRVVIRDGTGVVAETATVR